MYITQAEVLGRKLGLTFNIPFRHFWHQQLGIDTAFLVALFGRDDRYRKLSQDFTDAAPGRKKSRMNRVDSSSRKGLSLAPSFAAGGDTNVGM